MDPKDIVNWANRHTGLQIALMLLVAAAYGISNWVGTPHLTETIGAFYMLLWLVLAAPLWWGRSLGEGDGRQV